MRTDLHARAWPLYASEFVGTALLVGLGCSLVVLNFGDGSPVAALVSGAAERRALTGFLFGTVGALIAISGIGKVSGAHINPAVTLAFWLCGRIHGEVAVGYVAAQLAGSVVGALALRAWGPMGASVAYAATLPGPLGAPIATIGEAAATFCLITGLFVFLGHRRLRHVTPALFPVLYALLVLVEAPLSGASTNPARSLGPSVAAGVWRGWWAYWLGPLLGTLGAVGVLSAPWMRWVEIEVAKVFHFHHDRFGVFGNDGGRRTRSIGPATGSARAEPSGE